MPVARLSLRHGGAALGLTLALALGGCGGGDVTQDYAAGWNGICRDVTDAYRTFRSDVSAAATRSPDPGDATVVGGLRPAAVADDLAPAARKLRRALRDPLARAATLRPPRQWQRWQAQALRRIHRHQQIVDDGVRRLQHGDGDALASLALGGIGPEDPDAPQALRQRAPDCTAQR